MENLANAQALPTMRTLGLATGKAEYTRLTTRGYFVAMEARDPARFKLALAAVILWRDNDTWHIVSTLESIRAYPGEPIELYDLALGLARNGLDPCQKLDKLPDEKQAELLRLGATISSGSRLHDTLKYYNYADLLRRADGTVTLLDSTIERAREADEGLVRRNVGPDNFFLSLQDVYELHSKRLKSPYVPLIPFIREGVCRQLHIDESQFVDLLQRVLPAFRQSLLLLSRAPGPVPEDRILELPTGRFYYLSIYPKGGEVGGA